VAAIVAKSLFANPAAYRAKMLERTRIGLQHVMAAHSTAPISPDLIAMTDRVDKYVDLTTTSAVQRLLGAIGSEFHKYLFSMPAVSVLNGTIGRVQQDLVDRMEE
jgi:hypothetical protein